MTTLLALVACSKNEVMDAPLGSAHIAPQVTADFEDSQSRVSVSEDNATFTMSWTDKDEISVFVGTGNLKYTYSSADDAFTTTSTDAGNALSTSSNYAVYPYGEDVSISTAGVLSLNMPAEQAYAEKSFGLGANTMVAATATKEATNYSFKNVGGYLRLYLYGEDVTVSSITLEGNNGENLAGAATVTVTPGAAPTLEWASTATQSITLNCGDLKIGATEAEATEFWFVVPVTDFEDGFTVTVTDNNGYKMVKSTLNQRKIERNTVYSMTALEVKTVVEVATPIVDVVFNADGTAKNIGSLSELSVTQRVDDDGNTPLMATYTNSLYPHNNIVHFTHNNKVAPYSGGQVYNSFYDIDYSSSQTFKDKIANGYTVETIIMLEKSLYTDAELKVIGATEGGGFCIAANNQSEGTHNRYISFTNNIAGDYKHTYSTTQITLGQYYHVVGVLDVEGGNSYLYINGQLECTTAISGSLKFPTNANAHRVVIGADPGLKPEKNAQAGWYGDVGMLRIYENTLSAEDIAKRYESLTLPQKQAYDPILDVQFNADGSATDLSESKLTIERVTDSSSATPNLTTYAHPDLGGKYVARFTPASISSDITHSYYKIDYSSNKVFMDKLADGHTLEVVCMLDYDIPSGYTKEIKPFSSMQAGGTGIMVTSNRTLGNNWTFLTSGALSTKHSWEWVESGVKPERGVYYHIIGVWDPTNKTASIYIDGEKVGEYETSTYFGHASSDCRWFCIGGDPQSSTVAGTAFSGDVAIARVYDKPLTDAEVAKRCAELNLNISNAETIEADFLSNFRTVAEGSYTIQCEGLSSTDKLVIASADGSYNAECTTTNVTSSAMTVTLPKDLATGAYNVSVVKGGQSYLLGSVNFTIDSYAKIPQVIAHRGWHKNGVPENSMTGFKEAVNMGVYGSEIDVWVTTDGEVVVYHDSTKDGYTIQDSTYEQIKDLTLSNGETLPKLSDILAELKNSTKTKLIIEIKNHSTDEKDNAAVDAILQLVKDAQMEDMVEYISFGYNICQRIVAAEPTAIVGYINGDKAPATVLADGIKCIDYAYSVYKSNSSYIPDAQALGMLTNTWTVNSDADLLYWLGSGIDFISTDNPDTLQDMIATYFPN